MEVRAIRAGHPGLRPAPDEPGWQGPRLRQERPGHHNALSVRRGKPREKAFLAVSSGDGIRARSFQGAKRHRFPGELPRRQRGGDGKLVGRLRGRHTTHKMDGLAEDTPAVLQDEEASQVRAVLGLRWCAGDDLPHSRYTLSSGDQLLERARYPGQPDRGLLRERGREDHGGAQQRFHMVIYENVQLLIEPSEYKREPKEN